VENYLVRNLTSMSKRVVIFTSDREEIAPINVGAQMYNSEYWGRLFDNTLLYCVVDTEHGKRIINGRHIVSVEIKETE